MNSYANLWKVLGGLVLLAAICVGAFSWLQEHDARIEAQAESNAQRQTIAQAQQTMDAAKADQAQVAKTLQAQLATIEAERQKPVTPAQFVVDLSKALPQLPQAATVVQPAAPPATPGSSGAQAAVAPDPVVEIPAADLPALRDYKLSCDETGAKLDACQKTGADQGTQLTATQTQLKATKAERDSWEKAAKGGSWWHRTLTAGKWLLVGGTIGYVAGQKW